MAKLEYKFTTQQLGLIEQSSDIQVADRFNPISSENNGPGHYVKMSVFAEDGTLIRSFYSNKDFNDVKVIYGSAGLVPTVYSNPIGPNGYPVYAGPVVVGDPPSPEFSGLGQYSAVKFCEGEGKSLGGTTTSAPSLNIQSAQSPVDQYPTDEWVVINENLPQSVWGRIDCSAPPEEFVDYDVIGTPQLNLYRTKTDSNINFYFKPNESLSQAAIPGGNYRLTFDFLRSSIESLGSGVVNPRYIISEISPSRKEVRITPAYDGNIPLTFEKTNLQSGQLSFQEKFIQLLEYSAEPTSTYKFDYIMGFSQARSLPIVSYAFDNRDLTSPSLILKLNAPIPTDITRLQSITIEQQIFTTQTEDIIYRSERHQETLTGAGLDAPQFGGVHTPDTEQIDTDDFQSYSDMTGSLTDQSIESWIVSGSGFGVDVNLNIDYNDFSNHTFFGSATSKLDNFKIKLQNIETQLSRVSSSLVPSTGVTMVGDLKSLVQMREDSFTEIQRVRDTFTPYERFLYSDHQANGESSASAPSVTPFVTPSTPVNLQSETSMSFQNRDGFPIMYKHTSSAAGNSVGKNIDYFKGKYKAEQKPFYNHSGSVYLSFLLKSDSAISTFQHENRNYTYDDPVYKDDSLDGGAPTYTSQDDRIIEQGKDKLPSGAFWSSGSQTSGAPIGTEWRQFVFAASQSHWRPIESERLNLIQLSTEYNTSDKWTILSRIDHINSASNSPTGSTTGTYKAYEIKPYSTFHKSLGTIFTTGSEDLPHPVFNGTFRPAGELFRISGVPSSDGVKTSFITDIKLTKEDPSEHRGVYPFTTLYKTTSTTFTQWFDGLRSSASKYDEDNIHSLVNNLPVDVKEDPDSTLMKDFINMKAEQYDLIRNYIDTFSKLHSRQYDRYDGVPPNLLPVLGKHLGWNFVSPFTGSMSQYFGTSQDDIQVGGRSVEEVSHNTWKKVLNNLVHIYKTKGTSAGSNAVLNTYGYPSDTLGVQEFGGSTEEHNPSIITNEVSALIGGVKGAAGNVSFMETKEEFFSYLLNNDPYRTLNLDWHTNEAKPIEALEFVIKPVRSSNDQIIFESSGSASQSLWDIRLVATGSDDTRGSIQFRLNNSYTGSDTIANNAVSMSTSFLPIKNDDTFWNVMLLRVSSSISGSGTQGYKLFTGRQRGDKITQFEAISMSVSGGTSLDSNHRANENWSSSGSLASSASGNLWVGATYTGSIAEIRAWSTQLSASKFKQHILNKRSVVGNSITASRDNLLYRFALQENHRSGSDPLIKDANAKTGTDHSFRLNPNVLTGSTMYTSDEISIIKFSLRSGGTNQPDSNKIITNPKETIVSNLNPTNTSTRTLYDKSIENKRSRSTKVQITRSPQTVLNDFIINTLADYDVSDKFADPSSLHESEYADLNQFRDELFDHFDVTVDINKWVDAQADVFNPGLVDALKSNLPARAAMDSVGVLFEPTLLERNKLKNPAGKIESGSSEHFDMDWNVSDSYTLEDTRISELLAGYDLAVDRDILLDESHTQGTRDGEYNPTDNTEQTGQYDSTKNSEYFVTSQIQSDKTFDITRESQYAVPENIQQSGDVEIAPEGTNFEFNSASLKSFQNLHDDWGTTSDDTHFVNMAAKTADGFSNVNHDDPRYTFNIVGDVEILGSTEKLLVTEKRILINNYRSPGTLNVNIDYNNVVNFQNRELRDTTNLKYQYKSFVSSTGNPDGIQPGRPVGKTNYYSTSSTGVINYPSNHWTQFSEDGMRSNFISGHQNVGESFLQLENSEDLSTASFYSVNVGGENQLVVRRGKRESNSGTIETR
tara:strand:- start:3235 stop:8604 length:5370 start_codon:yes stop_codon:yes gene_type:complete